jgi:hypothetical protein
MRKPVVQQGKAEWIATDPRLLKAAQRLVRLYDGEQAGPFWLRAESIAALLAEELNRSAQQIDALPKELPYLK